MRVGAASSWQGNREALGNSGEIGPCRSRKLDPSARTLSASVLGPVTGHAYLAVTCLWRRALGSGHGLAHKLLVAYGISDAGWINHSDEYAGDATARVGLVLQDRSAHQCGFWLINHRQATEQGRHEGKPISFVSGHLAA